MGVIANGAFGKVYRVCLRSQPDLVFAMKVQPKAPVIARDAVQQIKHEISIHVGCHANQASSPRNR